MRALRGVLLAVALIGGAVLLGRSVEEASSTTTTVQTTDITFTATAADGTVLEITTEVTVASFSHFSAPDPSADPGPGMDFLVLDFSTPTNTGTGPSFTVFDSVPMDNIDFVPNDGAAALAQPADENQVGFLEDNASFAVPTSTTSGTLEIAPGTLQALEYPGTVDQGGGNFTTVTFQPASVPIVVPPATTGTTGEGPTTEPRATEPPTTQPTTPEPPTTEPSTTEPTIVTTTPTFLPPIASDPGIRLTSSKGLTDVQKVGTGTAGGVLVVLFVVPIWRRRAYRKADSEGRVIIDSPPVSPTTEGPSTIDPATSTSHEAIGTAARVEGVDDTRVDVKILGPLEIDGLVRPLDLSPARELLVFLSTHAGSRFTSTELRTAIWVEGRDQPKADTFHNYVTALRKALPPGTMVKAGTHHSFTEAISSDWGRFSALVAAHDDRPERLAEALGLLRGPPFDGAFSGRNSPYAWATDLAHRIEVAVEKTGHELAMVGLETGDLALADAGVAQVLKCLPLSLVAREDHLRLGAALGGRHELARRLRAARSTLGDDAQLLEPLARSLGWER